MTPSTAAMVQSHKIRYQAGIWPHIYTVLACVLLSQHVASDAALEPCMRGTYLTRHGSGIDDCEVCPDGTFMPEADHAHKQCYSCSKATDPNVEVVVQPCNITHDAIIMCRDGYYRRRAPNPDAKDECVACTPCDHPTLKCFNYTDTVCCLTKNYEAVHSFGDVYHCEERPCGPGQRFDEKAHQCVSCPEGTYMPQDVHKHTSCLKCARLEHSATYNSRIFHDCTDRSPTSFGCVPGFYRNISDESPVVEAMCTECRQCQRRTLRSCLDFQDSICECCDVTSTQSTTSTESVPRTRTDNPDNCSTTTYPGGGEPPSDDDSSQHKIIGLSVTLGITIVVFAIVTGCFYIRYKNKETYTTEHSTETLDMKRMMSNAK